MRSSRFVPAWMVFLVCSLLLMSVGLAMRVEAQQNFAGSLVPVSGLVQYRASGAQDWITLRGRQNIRVGDQIRTGADGFAQLNVVSGIALDIYPTSLLQIGVMQQRAERGVLVSIEQIVGKTLSRVDRALRPEDRFQVVLPTAGITVEGTQFWSLVAPNVHASIMSQEGEVRIISADGQDVRVDEERFVFIDFQLPSPPPDTCTDELRQSSTATLVVVPLNAAREQATRNFLTDVFTSNQNPLVRVFMRELLGLEAKDDAALSAEEDEQALQEILEAIRNVDLANLDLNDLMARYRTYWLSTYRSALRNPIAPATCGNMRQDAGETAENCPTDFSEMAFCGNNICETDRRGAAESVVNCPADCLPPEALALSCIARSSQVFGLATEVPPPTPPGGFPANTPTPTPIVPIGTVTPTPSQ
jgi:hypothetical protein